MMTKTTLRHWGWKYRVTACIAAAAAVLAACGGGGGGGGGSSDSDALRSPAQAKATALYFTDDFAAEHEAVWISVTKVSAIGPTGETVLAAFDPPRMINVPTLQRSGELFALAAVPVDATSVRIQVGTAARVQRLDGTSLDVTLAATQGFLEVRLDGWKRESGVLALDFDLPRFVLNGNTLAPATRMATDDNYAGWNQRYADVQGSVTVVSANAVTVQTQGYGLRQFTLDSNTTYVSARGAAWQPVVGDSVEVYTQVNGQGADGLQFTARVVKDKSAAAGSLTEVEGRITGINAGQVTVMVTKSKSALATGTLSFDAGTALFKRGSTGSLVVGAAIEAYLEAAGPGWRAAIIEVKGAAKTGDLSYGGYLEKYAELKGRVLSVAGDALVLRVLKAERVSGAQTGTDVAVSLASAYFEKGSLSCVVAGSSLDLKGAVNAAGVFAPIRAELEYGCANASPVGAVTPGTGTGTGTGTGPGAAGPSSVEAKGSITAVRPGEFDLGIYKLEGAWATPATVTVRYSNATYFNRITPTTLMLGAFVEIKGTLRRRTTSPFVRHRAPSAPRRRTGSRGWCSSCILWPSRFVG